MTVGTKILEAEGHWIMGRVMPKDFLKGVGKYLEHVAPGREDELMAAIKNRAEEIADADKDTAVDGPSEGGLAICAVVLAAYEQLLPLFQGDEQRTILYLQHVMATVLQRSYEITFETLSERNNPLDKIDKMCRKVGGFYGGAWDIDFERPEPGTFEMKITRCFFHEFFLRRDMPLLTTVFCAFDVNFMQAIDPSVSGLRAERTSLMSLGDDECRFAVLETDDPIARYTDALEQRFLDAK